MVGLALEKQARLVAARLKKRQGTPLVNISLYKSEKTIVGLVEEYNHKANDAVRNVLGTCRAILDWYEKYYDRASGKA